MMRPLRTRASTVAAALAMWLAARASLAAHDGVVAPRRLEGAPVPYPPDGRGDAAVILVLVIDTSGAVADVSVRAGVSPFAEAAASAVKTWHFAPATRDDTPVAARIIATVNFHSPAPRAPPRPIPPESLPGPLRRDKTSSRPPGSAAAAEPVEISVRGEREQPGTTHIPRSETRFIPGAFGDPFRVVEALPGMSPWLSGLPYYYVRGSPPESVGYFIDGVRIPLLFHVGAGPSTIAPALVDTVDLFPGGYPAAYGRYAGAIIAGETTTPDLSPADGPAHSPLDERRARGEFNVRVFDASAVAETPFDGGLGAAIVAGRYSYTGLLTSLIVPDYTVGYWDYQLRLAHRVGGEDSVTVFAFGAHDELTYKNSPTFNVEFHRIDLRYDHPLPGGHLRVAGTFDYDNTLTALQTSTGAGAAAALKGPGGRLRWEVEGKLSSQAVMHAGADAGVARFEVDRNVDMHHAPHTDFEGGAYADVAWRPSAVVEVVPGLRLDGYEVRGETVWAPQPRLAARVKVKPTVSWISSLGVAHQEATEEVFAPGKLPYPIEHSDSYQFSEGVELRLPASMRARATAFYSRLLAGTGSVNSAQERAAGVEFFFRRDFTQRLGGFVSYTLSRSDATSGAAMPRSTWDRTHVISAVIGYDLGSGWRVGGRFFLESGRPYRLICQTPDCSPGRTSRVYAVQGEIPAFHRLDVRLEKKWTFADGRWLTGTIECFNVFDTAEPTGVSYAASQGLAIVSQSAIILPSIGLEGGI